MADLRLFGLLQYSRLLPAGGFTDIDLLADPDDFDRHYGPSGKGPILNVGYFSFVPLQVAPGWNAGLVRFEPISIGIDANQRFTDIKFRIHNESAGDMIGFIYFNLMPASIVKNSFKTGE